VLEFEGNRGRVKRTSEGGEEVICPLTTMTPLWNWIAVFLSGVRIAQQPIPTAQECPICGHKLCVYESLERWSYLCSGCEEVGSLTELEEIAKQNGE